MKNLPDLTNRNPQMITRLAEPTYNWGCPWISCLHFLKLSVFISVLSFRSLVRIVMVSIVAENNFKNAENDHWKCFDKLVRIDNAFYQNKPFLFTESCEPTRPRPLAISVEFCDFENFWNSLIWPLEKRTRVPKSTTILRDQASWF